MPLDPDSVQRILHTIPSLYRGPGGAIAVVQSGSLIGQHVWGYADLSRRTPMTPSTLVPICSITKQMLCQALLSLERDPPADTSDIRQQLTSAAAASLLGADDLFASDGLLSIERLCDMQSGLRDYWALCTLWGSAPETPFSIGGDSRAMLERVGRTRLHFPPGAAMSYSNTNYHVLGRALEAVTGGGALDALLAERVFGPAGMATARLAPDTAKQPGGCVGYEGDERYGFFPAVNRIEWAGDAGVVASLEDMVAYEKHFDRLWSDPDDPWYRELAGGARDYGDGAPARYRMGLSHVEVRGVVATVGHGGALRGYRLHRRYAPAERLSVVVLFNHEASAEGCAAYIIEKVLGLEVPEADGTVKPAREWFGVFLDEASQLAVTVSPGGRGKVSISYTGDQEVVPLVDPRNARSRNMIAEIEGDVLRAQCLEDNLKINAKRVVKRDSDLSNSSFSGKFYCVGLDSTFHCSGQGGLLYGAFDGFLGQGPPHLMRHLGGDVWFLADPRGMDAPAPGDWTVVFHRDDQSSVVGVTIGCWLARKLEYVKA